MFVNAIILDSGVQFLSAENLPAVVNIACCTNMLNDFSYEICRTRTPVQAKNPLHHTGDHIRMIEDDDNDDMNWITQNYVLQQNSFYRIIWIPTYYIISNWMPFAT